MRTFPLDAVRLLDGPMRRAQAVDLEYLLALDVDRLLAPFRREAGLPREADSYGNWEGDGLDGHILGHYLSACSALVAATGDERARDRLAFAVEEIERCQLAGDDGYVGGIPGGRALWAAVAAGDFAVSGFELGGRWVPWYNLHKLFAGLIDAWRIAGEERAGAVVIRLADWWLRTGARLDDRQFERMLTAEFGGMNEVFADLAEATGRSEFLAMAARFSDRRILDPLLDGRDALTGLHANTQIPKAVGYARLGAVSADERLIGAAQVFWDVVASRRSVAIGGNSTREHFHPTDDFSSQVEEREGPETCNTVNMVKLSKVLLALDGDVRYVDYVERALFNHLLSAQHPEHGGFVYFTPLRPAHYRVYSQVHEGFWCCVGSGLEAQGRYGELVFGHDERGPVVNLFVPSELDWGERGLRLRIDTRFPENDVVRIAVDVDAPASFVLRVRVPRWAAAKPTWTLDGTSVEPDGVVDGYAEFDRLWSGGERLDVTVPMRVSSERLGDGSDWVAFLHGPVVLAARSDVGGLDGLRADGSRMGHVAHGPLVPLSAVPIAVHDGDPATLVERVEGDALRFVLRADDGATVVGLEPFAGIHDARYTAYWPDARRELATERRAALLAEDTSVLGLDARTIDVVTAGEQQPELDHELASEGSEAGTADGMRFRSGTGWFGYRLADGGGKGVALRVTYLRSADERSADIEVDGVTVDSVTLLGGDREQVEIDHPLRDLDRGSVEGPRVVFRAAQGSRTPDVLTIRLLRA